MAVEIMSWPMTAKVWDRARMQLVGFVMSLLNHVVVTSVNRSIYSFLTSGDFCHLLINFANSLDPNQVGQNIGPELVFLKGF